MFHRRAFLGAGSGLLGAAALGGLPRALAAHAGGDAPGRKFIFVVNYGGWDPTRVFNPAFQNASVDMERDAEPVTLGGLTFVDHQDRPSVRGFFEDHHERSLFVNGILVPSVAHENCLHLIMTGTTSSVASDWPALVAAHGPGDADFPLPGVVVSGPSFPGGLGGVVTRTGSSSQLEGLLSGEIITQSDVQTGRPDARAEAIMDDYMRRRAAAAADYALDGRARTLKAAYDNSLSRARSLKDLLHVVDFSSGTSLGEQIRLATDLLSRGVTRVATIASSYAWDSHVDNDATQSTNFEGLFSDLRDLMAQLHASPGQWSQSLADETVVVVISEMGRTPALNPSDGKDHWPYTSALVVGPGVTGSRTIGATDEFYYGERIDPATGELDDDGRDLSSDMFGATLLALAGIDPTPHLPGVTPIEGALV